LIFIPFVENQQVECLLEEEEDQECFQEGDEEAENCRCVAEIWGDY
jgi:hypothetical protein